MKVIFFLLILPVLMFAQTNQNPCSSESHNQFDFWLGEWEVTNPQGVKVGENKITKIEGNCVLLEEWTGAKTTTGKSMNYYDPKGDTWNQLWLDNTGVILKLKGHSPEAGKMILKSDLVDGQKGKYYNQITWTKNEDGTVTQLWEAFDEDGKLLNVLFTGIYALK